MKINNQSYNSQSAVPRSILVLGKEVLGVACLHPVGSAGTGLFVSFYHHGQNSTKFHNNSKLATVYCSKIIGVHPVVMVDTEAH